MRSKAKIHLDVLISREEGGYIAHCLQLDLVATGETLEDTKQNLLDVVQVQINYAFQHDNLEYLFKPAPGETWRRFFVPMASGSDYRANRHEGEREVLRCQ